MRVADEDFLAINRRSNLFLAKDGHGDEARFASLFARTWRRLPSEARESMLAHWRKDCKQRRGFCWMSGTRLISPCIRLAYGWISDEWIVRPIIVDSTMARNRSIRRQMNPALGMVTGGGYQILFRAPAVDQMPEAMVQDLVAHELSHCYQFATGKMENFESRFECEQDTDDLMEEWGFDNTSREQWAKENGYVVKVSLEEFLAKTMDW